MTTYTNNTRLVKKSIKNRKKYLADLGQILKKSYWVNTENLTSLTKNKDNFAIFQSCSKTVHVPRKISSGDTFSETESIVAEHGSVCNRRLHLRLSFSRIPKRSYGPDAIRTSRQSVSRIGTARYKARRPKKSQSAYDDYTTHLQIRDGPANDQWYQSFWLLDIFSHYTYRYLFLNKIARFIFGRSSSFRNNEKDNLLDFYKNRKPYKNRLTLNFAWLYKIYNR